MTNTKPSIIYSIVVEMLKSKRTGGSPPPRIIKLPDHARCVLSVLCEEAVAEGRDIHEFRETSESIFSTLLKNMHDVDWAEVNGLSPRTKSDLAILNE